MQEQIIHLPARPMSVPVPIQAKSKKVISKRIIILSLFLILVIAATGALLYYQRTTDQNLKTAASALAARVSQTIKKTPQLLSKAKVLLLGANQEPEKTKESAETILPAWLDAEAISKIDTLPSTAKQDPTKLNLGDIESTPAPVSPTHPSSQPIEPRSTISSSPALSSLSPLAPSSLIAPLPANPTIDDLTEQFSQISAQAELLIVQSRELLSQNQSAPTAASPTAASPITPAQLEQLSQQLNQITLQTQEIIAQAQEYITQLQSQQITPATSESSYQPTQPFTE